MLTLTEPFPSALPAFISTRRGDNGAWQRFERGQIDLWDFYVAFGQELSDIVLGNVWYRGYCARKGIGERSALYLLSFFPLLPTYVHFVPDDPKKMALVSNDIPFPFFPTGHISDCPKLPEKLEIDGRDVSAARMCFSFHRSFISDTRLSGARESDHTRIRT